MNNITKEEYNNNLKEYLNFINKKIYQLSNKKDICIIKEGIIMFSLQEIAIIFNKDYDELLKTLVNLSIEKTKEYYYNLKDKRIYISAKAITKIFKTRFCSYITDGGKKNII